MRIDRKTAKMLIRPRRIQGEELMSFIFARRQPFRKQVVHRIQSRIGNRFKIQFVFHIRLSCIFFRRKKGLPPPLRGQAESLIAR